MKRKRPKELIDWDKVFRLRCRSKSGGSIGQEESEYMHRAWQSDPERYAGMDKAVFEETKPFGAR